MPIERWRVTLIIDFDTDKAAKPELWNWSELLDLSSGDEGVYVDDTEFIENVFPEDDEK